MTSTATELKNIVETIAAQPLTNLKPILPLMLQLRGEPYTIENHFPFEPFFRTRMPRTLVFKCGRQISKSTSLAAQGLIITNTIPHFATLYVTPLFQMISRFSTNYVRQFIEESPVKSLWVDSTTSNNVLQRTFTNHSKMLFTFAFQDCTRARGVAVDRCSYDEIQDIDDQFLSIINETMSASRWALSQYSGTPKTLENTIEQLWLKTSQAEWVIPCRACNHWNVPTLLHDLDKMIGPWSEDISEDKPGIVCAKCSRPIFPRMGRWVHARPELRFDNEGYHIPQVVMPMHYADPDKWKLLLGKREGAGNTPLNVFYNEVCGESYDVGAKLVTVTDLKAAATLGPNIIASAKTNVDRYTHRVLAVDWGGGGADRTSFTAVAVIGMLPGGSMECIYGWRSLTPHDYIAEAKEVLRLVTVFRCSHIVHDYSGAGEGRHMFIVHSGFPQERTIACSYIRAASGAIMRFIPASEAHPRDHYRIDKSRSLVLTCSLVKTQHIRFFEYDYKGSEQAGLLHDFLALVEDKVDSRTGTDIYTIIRNQSMTDDFAQAVNIGVMALCYMTGNWPNTAKLAKMESAAAAVEASHMFNPNTDW